MKIMNTTLCNLQGTDEHAWKLLAREEQKYARLHSLRGGMIRVHNEIRNARGKRFLLISSLPYSVLFSRSTTFLKKHFDAIFNPRISGSSGLWKVIYSSLLSPISEKSKTILP